MTSSPSPLVTGRDSPVSMDSLRLLRPSTITPSVGIFSPGRTRTRSPARNMVTGTSSMRSPSASRWATVGMSLTRASKAREAPITERISIQCPRSMMSMRVASSQKKTLPERPSTTALE